MHVPFLKPDIRQADIDAASSVLAAGWLTRGPLTIDFEKKLAAFCGTAGASIVGSGTAAIHAALVAAGVTQDDEVITTPLSAVQTSNAVLYAGAKPVFADIDPKTGLIDIARIEERVTAKTKAILPVHYYGQMVDMRALSALAKKHDLVVVEDAAHALGAARDDVRPGEMSFAAAFSFHAAKQITSGQGGAVISNNETALAAVNAFCDSGVERVDGERRMTMLGFKYPITSFQVALLDGQLDRFPDAQAARRRVFDWYLAGFADVPNVRVLAHTYGEGHGCHVFTILVDPERRSAIRSSLKEAGVETALFHEPIHLEPYYRNAFSYRLGDFPHAERFGASLISLPTYPQLTEEEATHVIESVRRAVA